MSGPGSVRLLHVITDLKVGGAETMLVKLAPALERAGFATQVASLLSGGALADALRERGIAVHGLGASRGRVPLSATWRLLRLARRLRPTHVQGWMYHGNLAAHLAARAAPGAVREFWNVRQGLADIGREPRLTRAVIRLGGRLSARPEAVVYNAAVSRDQHVALGYSAANARLLPNGFDLELFRPAPRARAELRAELGLPARTPLVGLLGRHHPLKGHDLFLDAVARLRHRRPDVHALCAGEGAGPESAALAPRAAAPDLAGHVHLLGLRADAPRLLAGLDVLCVASRDEGFPNVLGEALACGTGVVTTDVGEARAIVAGLGPVVPPGDADALAAGLAEVLDRDADTRARLAAAGRERVAARWSLAAVAARYAALYTGTGGGADA